MWRLALFSLSALLASGSIGGAMELLTYRFAGDLVPFGTPQAPYGIPLTPAPFSAEIQYLTDSPPDLSADFGPEGVGYRQNIPGGFTATLAGATVVADEYFIVIRNGTSADRVTFLFSPEFLFDEPHPDPVPLTVNGVPVSDGYLELVFEGNSSVFDDTSLPERLPLGQLTGGAPPLGFHFYADQDPPGGAVALFLVNNDSLELSSVESVPEPATIWMAVLGAGALLLFWRWRHSRRH